MREVIRLKHLLTKPLQYGANETGEQYSIDLPRYVRITDITADGRLRGNNAKSLAMKTAELYLLSNGDILFARSGATAGKTFIYEQKHGSCAFAGYLIRASVNQKKILPRFLYYFTNTSFYDEWRNAIFIQATIQNISAERYNQLLIPLPPLEKQSQIVRVIDWKVSQINKLINAKKKQIGLLQEQEKAYVNFVFTHNRNKQPQCRAKYLFVERNERSEHGHETHLSMSQKYGLVNDDQLDERRMLSESYAGGKICYENDIVLNRLKAHLGVFALAPQKGVISPDYTVLQPLTEKILPKYAEFYLKSDICRHELHVRVRGVVEGFWRLYTDDFNTISMPLPPIVEQMKTVQLLERKRNQTSQLVQILNNEIALLHEYRTRLISDVVTGKMNVQGMAIPIYDIANEDSSESDAEFVFLGEDEKNAFD